MKTTTTITLDAETKEEAMDIIQNRMKTSLSSFVQTKITELLEKDKEVPAS
jgi:hypothetical protein